MTDSNKIIAPDSISKYIAILVFMFPIAGVSVRHWYSVIFWIIVLFALFEFKKNYLSCTLNRNDKFLIFGLTGFFVAYLISIFIHGWYDAIGVEFRFLFAVPLYLMFISRDILYPHLIKGTIISAYIIFFQSLYDSEILLLDRANGIYGPLLLGPIAVLCAYISFFAFFILRVKIWKGLSVIAIPLSLYSIIASQSRSAYFAVIILSLLIIINFPTRILYKIISFFVFLFVCILSFLIFEKVQNPTKRIFTNIATIISYKDENQEKILFESGQDRINIWRAALHLAKDNPLLGIGYGKYNILANEYRQTGKLPGVNHEIMHAHSHNIFLEAVLTKGMIGLIALLVIFVSLFRILTRIKLSYKFLYLLSVGTVSAFLCFGLFEAAPINKGNFVAVFLIYSLMFVSTRRIGSVVAR